MTAQDVIADQIEGEVLGSGWDVAATRDQANAMARRAVKALETLGYAVVKLPEPSARNGDVSTWKKECTLPRWEVRSAPYTDVVVDAEISDGLHPSQVRDFAGVLLAAAAHSHPKSGGNRG